MFLSKKIWLYILFYKIFQACAFSDEINFEKFKNLIEGVKIQTPVTLTFFLINPN
jgi:hypothetical protein